jgi:hypothetical protein
MKSFYLFSILIATLVLISCGEKKEEAKEVAVGMTFEEVEGILGKPVSIIRGMNELTEAEEIIEDPLRVVSVDTVDTKNEENRWMAPQELKTSKEELYVTWIYDDVKTDDFYLLYNNYKEGETITKKVPVYYLGDKKVSKEEYNAATGSLYIEPGKTGKQQVYDKTGGKTKIPADSLKSKKTKMQQLQKKGKMIEKRIEYVTKTVGKSDAVIESVDRENYEVEYKLCVVFDEASQRVIEHDYFPFTISKLEGND